MVQEFHVLRCYSCQTFQVQQVKKSKKWNCKMCGEKQSVIKEFGRGSGADCRHHVQKLNARRGETLEEQDQKAWLHWEEVGSEAVEDCEDMPQDYDQQNVCSKVEEPSLWGKYLDKPVKGSGEGQSEEKAEEEEEENVFMDRNQIHGNINVRKRKMTGWQNGGNHCGEEDTMAAPNSWRTAKPAKQTRYSSSFAPVEKSHKAPASCRPVSGYTRSPPTSFASSKPPLTTAPDRLNTVTSSHPRSSSTTAPDRLNTVTSSHAWSSSTTAPDRLNTVTSSHARSSSTTAPDRLNTVASSHARSSSTTAPDRLNTVTSSHARSSSTTAPDRLNTVTSSHARSSSTTAPDRLNTVTSSHARSSSTTAVSKWAQFLTTPSRQDEDEDEEEWEGEGQGQSCWMSRDEAGNVESHINPFHLQNKDNVTLSCEQPSCGDISAVGGPGSVFLKKALSSYSRLKSTLSHCGSGEETNSKRDPRLTHMSSRLECTEPIRGQPQPTKPPFPSLSVGSLFNTGEDFDDTFDLDDLKVEPTHRGII